MKVQRDLLHDRHVPGGLNVPEVLLSKRAGCGEQSCGGGLSQSSCGSIHRGLHHRQVGFRFLKIYFNIKKYFRYTYYALEFLKKIEPNSCKTMGDFLEVYPKRLCISTVGKRTDLFNRDPHKVPITDYFFGPVRHEEGRGRGELCGCEGWGGVGGGGSGGEQGEYGGGDFSFR